MTTIFMCYLSGFLSSLIIYLTANTLNKEEAYPLTKSIGQSLIWPFTFAKYFITSVAWFPKQFLKEVDHFLNLKKGE